MSYKQSSSSHRDSSRRYGNSRRDSPPRRSRRSPSPSREKEKPRDPKSLPETFGRQGDKDTFGGDLNVLQLMKSSYENSPLNDLYECVKDEKKIKIWTRNFKEVRGILSGYVTAFDKHWNLLLRDVDEVYLRKKKTKTPFLRDLEPNEDLPDMPAKVPRKKKDGETAPVKPKEEPKEGAEKKKRRKKSKIVSEKRYIAKMFVRGDNIVMICPLNDEEGDTDEGEEQAETEAA